MKNKVPEVLYIGYTWPEPEATAAGVRTLQLLKFFKFLNYKITFCSAAAKTPHSSSLGDYDINCISIRLNHDSFDKLITEINPAIVVFDRFLTEEYFGWRVAEGIPSALRILDTQDLHSLRHSREKALKNGTIFSPEFWQMQEITLRELASIYRCDLSLVISKFEMDWLKTYSSIDPSLLYYLPFVFDTPDAAQINNIPDFVSRKDFCFVGNGKHSPNIDAIKFLKEDIWPRIRNVLPEANLHIYGAYFPKKIIDLHQPEEGFYIKGWIKNVGEVLQNIRVNLLPLRFGAGLKGKLFQAASLGTPSVMTAVGAEGTPFAQLTNQLGTDPEDFAEKAIRLYNEKGQWDEAKQKGLKLLEEEFGKERFHTALHNTLQDLHQNLDNHRRKNLTGRMLLHHTLGSSRYLSKWISLKQQMNQKDLDESITG
ncbi:MAG: glycosyltransferase family 4 protein [Eudoraea sp.]|nr:glycosyltransferase family 4 protein [Eudoraea sp.]